MTCGASSARRFREKQMADKDIRMLVEAIVDYLQWEQSIKASGLHRPLIRDSFVLIDFLRFATHREMAWEDMFTPGTLKEFSEFSGFKHASRVLTELSGFLYSSGKIHQPLTIPKRPIKLPDPFDSYLHLQSHKASSNHLRSIKNLLSSFHAYLEKHRIALAKLKIEDLDRFLAELKVARSTRSIYRYCLRGFLTYLYRERRMVNKDLAPLLVGPRMFCKNNHPPRFLRPQEVQTLFASLSLSTPSQIRTYAIVHLAYALGLRPAEISTITLDDISFRRGELTLPNRKELNPVTLPLPEQSIKAIAAYVAKARPKSASRRLFLNIPYPYIPMQPSSVCQCISKAMKRAGLPSTAYWLRHTYAQNLLHMGRSIYEIKEMLGHEEIRSSQRYLSVHVDLMRKVLFHETL
jgi:integrase/recombinase XerD